ncbi:dihydrofolate reductase family protein [Amycolatopsis panacis]|uniref:Riboflavin biosynthesis protein RibD n=1 Tax=Amycolatopsis panacis TaxID=2340917 RepID=A0A419HMM4_9PSEU|nr:dihydrofolate reductase family protein [Amycolatopsis panacis]RJQ77336.1 5-amino-6-(5-phosphoribosylamino)uracil reductase [Amycolatopsis panacis]
MTERPHVLLSAAQSLDGYLDDASDTRLLLSNEDDFAEVDRLRAEADAILVGAGTVRADNPRLLVRSAKLRQERLAAGKPEQPIKATVTAGGDLDPAARFFTTGDAPKLVYAPPGVADGLAGVATVVTIPPSEGAEGGAGTDATTGGERPAKVGAAGSGTARWLGNVLDDLAARGVRKLLVEGGGAVHTQFLDAGLADEVRLAVAPLIVGDPRAPRFLAGGAFPRPLELTGVGRLGDVAVLHYRAADEPSALDVRRLRDAIELADRCPPSATFRVGAVIGLPDGTVLATGHSGEGDPRNHAEEAALSKVAPDDPRLAEATMYSSLEPCSARASHPKSCTQLILESPISRVVMAWREPSLFVDCEGVEWLTAAGRRVIEVPALAADVRRANTHLPGVRP